MSNIIRFIDRDEFLTPFDSLFDKLMKQNFPEFAKEVGVDFFHNGSYPKIDAIEYPDKVVIEAEIPGLKKDEISVKIENNVLTITGGKQKQAEHKDGKYIMRELKKSSFKRSFNLSETLDQKSIEAKFEDGILIISLKKVIKEEPKGFEVKIG